MRTSETIIFSDESSKDPILHTQIPDFVVKKFNLKEGTKLDWQIRNAHGMEILALIPLQ